MPKFQFARGWGWIWWVVAAELVFLGIEAMPTLRPAPTVISAARVATVAAAAGRVSLQPILDFQPFGATDPPVAAPEPAAATARVTAASSLVLQGVLLRDDQRASRVLVSTDGGPAQIYAVGDLLPGAGTLSGIEADRIWIDLGGQMQILGFPDPGTGQPLPTEAEAQTGTANAAESGVGSDVEKPAVKSKAQSLLQPDLRHLIPGLVTDAPDQP